MPERSEQELVARLVDGVSRGEEITLLVGSGLTGQAVPRVSAMLRLAERYATGRGDDGDLSRALAQARGELGDQATPVAVYLAYRRVFADWVSGGEFDLVAQQAVLEAYRPVDWEASPLAAHSIWQRLDLQLGERLENAAAAWDLPAGVSAIGRILAARRDEFGNRVLTTNFDPLIEIAVRRADARASTVALTSDGGVAGYHGSDGAVRVIHLHGFWRPTVGAVAPPLLHPPAHLVRVPAGLAATIADRLTGDCVCVVGYGGWDDVVPTALRDVATARPGLQVLWALHRAGPEAEREESALAGILGPGVTFYEGVDGGRMFPALADALGVPPVARVVDPRRRIRHTQWERELISLPDARPPAQPLRLLHQLESRFDWGLGLGDGEPAPALLFWPVRLRQRASLIHAVQALVAGALSARGVRVVVCLDDFGVPGRPEAAERFRTDALRWMRRTDRKAAPTFVSLQEFVEDTTRRSGPASPEALRRPVDPWSVGRAFYGEHNPSLYSLLAGLKVVPNIPFRELDKHAQAIVQALLSKDSNRLLMPMTVWACLNDLLLTEPTSSVMTLGGRDEQLFWAQWRETFSYGVNQLYNPYIKSLSNESGMVRWSSVDELHRHLVRARELDGWDDEHAFIPWLAHNAMLLPRYLAAEPVPVLDGYRIDSWVAFAAALEDGAPVLQLLATEASALYLPDGVGPGPDDREGQPDGPAGRPAAGSG